MQRQKTSFSLRSQPADAASFLAPQIELLNYMVNNIGDELMLLRCDGTIAYANEAAVKGLGFPLPALLKKHVSDFFGDKMNLREWQSKYFTVLKKKRKPITFDIERLGKGKEPKTMEITAVYMPYGPEEYILSIARDITSRIEKEEKIRETNKMKALSLFVSGTAQEIKYPLEVVLKRIQLMMHKYKHRDFEYMGFKEFRDIMDTMQNINDQVRYCCDVAGKLLVLNKRKAGINNNDCDVNEVIRSAMALHAPQLKVASVKLALVLGQKLPRAEISMSELEEIIVNVTANAIQAMPSGGHFTVKTYFNKAQRQIGLELKDDGTGMTREVLSRAFEPFFTTRPGGAGHNAGLGLSIAYSIIKDRRGDISLKSSLQHGTIVKIFLPIAK